MGKSQKKGSGGAFLCCDIILTRQRQDTIKRHRARSSAEMRRQWSRDDGRGKIAAQPPPRRPSPFQWGRWYRAANTAVKRAHNLRDDGRGKIAAQPPPRKPSPRAGKSQKKGSCGAFLRCDIILTRQRQDTFSTCINLLTLQFSSLRICSHLRRASRLSFRLPLTNGMGWDFFFC